MAIMPYIIIDESLLTMGNSILSAFFEENC